LDLSLLNFSSFIEIITVANFTFAFTDLLTLKVVHTVVRVPVKLNKRLYELLEKALQYVAYLGPTLGEGSKLLQSLPRDHQEALDDRCRLYQNIERVWCFAMGFYGLLVLLLSGFSTDLSEQTVCALLSWTNAINVLALVVLYFTGVSAGEEHRARAFTITSIGWLLLAIVLFCAMILSPTLVLFQMSHAGHFSVVFTLLILTFPFIRHFFVRFRRTRSLNKAVRDAWVAEIKRVEEVYLAAKLLSEQNLTPNSSTNAPPISAPSVPSRSPSGGPAKKPARRKN